MRLEKALNARPADKPLRKARFTTTIVKEWQERVGDAFEDRDEVVCTKSGTFNVYDRRGRDEYKIDTGGSVACPTTHAGKSLVAEVSGSMAISDEVGDVRRDIKMVSALLSVRDASSTPLTGPVQVQEVQYVVLGSYDLDARSFVTVLESRDWLDCGRTGSKSGCARRYPVAFTAFVEIEDAP